MPDYSFGGLIDSPNVFTWVSGGTNPGPTIDEAGDGLPEASVGQIYTYTSGSSYAVTITDNDSAFGEGDGSQQTLTNPATINGTTYSAGTRLVPTGQMTFVDQATGTSYTVYTGSVNTTSSGQATPTDFYIWRDGIKPPDGASLRLTERAQPNPIPYETLPPPCFTRGTMIETDQGPRAVETLKIGDKVLTMNGHFEPVRWIASRKLSADTLNALPKMRPIRIAKGALGANSPAQDLVVSPQHRVRLASAAVRKHVGKGEILVPAKKLVGLPGITVDDSCEAVDYFHLLLDRHSLVNSNGAWTETLLLGKEFLKTLSREAHDELAFLFPGLFSDETFTYDPAAPIVSRQRDLKGLIAALQP
ncbi:Hint domain-containing protein [Paracoccaceae bacterium GXU_MW_L88]